MMFKNYGVFAIAMMMACNGKKDDATDTDGDTDVVSATAATLRGSAKDSDGTAQHGTVRVMRIKSDGTTETASIRDAETDSAGKYRVYVEEASGPESNLIVEVTFDDATTAHGLVTTELKAGVETTMAPLDDETSAEADIYKSLRIDGTWDSAMSASVLRAFVSSDVGTEWAAAAGASRTSLYASMGAAVSGWGHASDDANATHAVDAEAALTVELGKIDVLADVSGTSTSSDALAALVTVWTTSSFSSADVSYFAAAAAEAHDSVGAPNDVSDASSANLAVFRAKLATTAISDAWGDAGAGTAPSEVALMLTLSTVLDGGGALDLKLDAAWASYVALSTTAFVSSLDAASGLAVVSATSIATDAQVALSTDVGAASNRADQAGADVAALMAAYRTTVQADVATALIASLTMTDVQANAIAVIQAELHANVTTP